MRLAIRYLSITIIGGALLWFVFDRGFEPILTSLAGTITLLGTFDFRNWIRSTSPELIEPKPRNDSWEDSQDSREFFIRRFREAFPGIRRATWFIDPKEMIRRLAIVLAPPLRLSNSTGNSSTIPIWWWRGGGNNGIEIFRHLGGRKILINRDKLILDRLAAINDGNEDWAFLYLEARADKPSGANKISKSDIARWTKELGYCDEEYGLYHDRAITRAEWEDRSAIIDGIHVNLADEADLRRRYLTQYNLIIAPQRSPINNSEFDLRLEEILNGMIHGTHDLDYLAKAVRRMPRSKIPI